MELIYKFWLIMLPLLLY